MSSLYPVPQDCSPLMAEQEKTPSAAIPDNVYLHFPEKVRISVTGPDAPDRRQQEAFIREKFQLAHNAEIHHFMPEFLTLQNTDNQLVAICGMRSARNQALFLEQYLELPIEQVLSLQTGKAIRRESIIEVGNLAISSPSHIRKLLASLNTHLHTTDAEWVVFTGIASLYNSLIKLNIPMYILANADVIRLPAEQRSAWGSYYHQCPQVIAVPRYQRQI